MNNASITLNPGATILMRTSSQLHLLGKRNRIRGFTRYSIHHDGDEMKYILTYQKDGEKLVLGDQQGHHVYFNSLESAKQAQKSFSEVGIEMEIESYEH